MKILITGATSGLAYDTALNLESRGHTIYLCSHEENQKDNLEKQLTSKNLNIKFYKLDICNANDLKLLDILDYDIIWAHAGIGCGGALLALDNDVIRKNYDVNVFQTLEVVKRAYQNMEKRKIKGKIFVTSSMAAYLPLDYLGCYTSSKAALSQICSTIRKELRQVKSNISLTLIEPGAYHTGFNQVMIDNKTKYLEQNNAFSHQAKTITEKQKKLFSLIEKKTYHDIVNKITREMEKTKPIFRIRKPLFQQMFIKLYIALFK